VGILEIWRNRVIRIGKINPILTESMIHHSKSAKEPRRLYSVTTLERGKHAVIMEMAVSAEIYFQPL
jgi:hypothetical protein